MDCRPFALVLASLLTCSTALAQRPMPEIVIHPDPEGPSDEAGAELVGAFGRFCLQRFPEHADMAEGADGKVMPLSPEETRQYLRDERGRGWFFEEGGTYVVLVEDRPYRICAVQRLYAALPKYRLIYDAITGLWAASEANRGPFQIGEAVTFRRGGATTTIASRMLPPIDGKSAETFLDVRTIYPDGQILVRLARSITTR